MYFETPYYVVPTGAEKAFAVLLKAMEEEGKFLGAVFLVLGFCASSSDFVSASIRFETVAVLLSFGATICLPAASPIFMHCKGAV